MSCRNLTFSPLHSHSQIQTNPNSLGKQPHISCSCLFQVINPITSLTSEVPVNMQQVNPLPLTHSPYTENIHTYTANTAMYIHMYVNTHEYTQKHIFYLPPMHALPLKEE